MLTIFILLLSLNSFAQDLDVSLCQTKENDIIKRITPKHKPNYFFKASDDGRYIFYINNQTNYRLDTMTGEELVLPGSVDPVPSPDGKILSSINFKTSNLPTFSMNLVPLIDWDVPRTPDKKPDLSKVYTDSNAQKTYQSVGILGNSKYRIITYENIDRETGSVKVQDYTYTSTNNFTRRWVRARFPPSMNLDLTIFGLTFSHFLGVPREEITLNTLLSQGMFLKNEVFA